MRVGDGQQPIGGAGSFQGREVAKPAQVSAEPELPPRIETSDVVASDRFLKRVSELASRVRAMPEVRSEVVAEAKRLLSSGKLDTAEAFDGAAQSLLKSVASELE